jgi:hypothetical protein
MVLVKGYQVPATGDCVRRGKEQSQLLHICIVHRTAAPCFASTQPCSVQVCLLRSMLCALGYLDGPTLQDATTLLLLLLYDVGFKYDCTAQLLDYYEWLLQVSDRRSDGIGTAAGRAGTPWL